MTIDETKNELKRVINILKSMTDEYKILYNEIDNLSEEEFDVKSEYIQDKYSKRGIELF